MSEPLTMTQFQEDAARAHTTGMVWSDAAWREVDALRARIVTLEAGVEGAFLEGFAAARHIAENGGGFRLTAHTWDDDAFSCSKAKATLFSEATDD